MSFSQFEMNVGKHTSVSFVLFLESFFSSCSFFSPPASPSLYCWSPHSVLCLHIFSSLFHSSCECIGCLKCTNYISFHVLEQPVGLDESVKQTITRDCSFLSQFFVISIFYFPPSLSLLAVVVPLTFSVHCANQNQIGPKVKAPNFLLCRQ